MTTDGDLCERIHEKFRRDVSCPSDCLRALVVDDDSITARLACRMLEALGFSVRVAHGSEQALSVVEEGEFDLLLTDLIMPHLNGFDLAKRFREQSEQMRIVIMTGCNPIEVREKMQEDTVNSWLFKPLNFAVLHATISGLFPTVDEYRLGE